MLRVIQFVMGRNGYGKKEIVLEYHRAQEKNKYFGICFDALQMDHSGNLGHELEVGLRLLSSYIRFG